MNAYTYTLHTVLSVLCMHKHIHKVYGFLQTSHSQVQKGSKETQELYVEGTLSISYCWSYKQQSVGGFIAEESRGEGEVENLRCGNKDMIYHFILPFSLNSKAALFYFGLFFFFL